MGEGRGGAGRGQQGTKARGAIGDRSNMGQQVTTAREGQQVTTAMGGNK